MGPSIEPGGLSARSRRDLATLFGAGQRTVTVDAAAAALGVSSDSAARRLSAWASRGWLRRVRRGLYIAVPVDARDPATWNEDPFGSAGSRRTGSLRTSTSLSQNPISMPDDWERRSRRSPHGWMTGAGWG